MTASIQCNGCGADLIYKPGTKGLTCNYCNHYTEFEAAELISQTAKEEIVLEDYLQSAMQTSETIEQRVVACTECGARTELKANQQSSTCPFCDTPLVVAQAQINSVLKPKGLLPFQIDKADALSNVKKWMSELWFAPGVLKQQAQFDKIHGVYLPFWTYDCSTQSDYTGRRGDKYEREEARKNADGQLESHKVDDIRWQTVTGSVVKKFDDILVPATKSFSLEQLGVLEPWDLQRLVDYKDEYLRGFNAETYAVDVATGYKHAKIIMDKEIKILVEKDIGGNEQEISTLNTRYSGATFKHILLPVWISAYHYQGKLFQIIVNARTGAVYGERPWSRMKLAVLVVGIVAVVAAFVFLKR